MKNSPQTIRALLIEDSEDDARLLITTLTRGGYAPDWRRVESEPELRAALAAQEWDVVFCDYSMPQFDAPSAMRTLREADDGLTVIVVSGNVGEEVAVEAMRLGANDFILKHNLGRIVPAMERELRAAEARRERLAATEELREREAMLQHSCAVQMSLFNALSASIALVDERGVILDVNESWKQFALDNNQDDPNFCIGQNYLETCRQVVPMETAGVSEVAVGLEAVLRGKRAEFIEEYPCHSPTRRQWYRLSISPLVGGPTPGAVVMHIDITERMEAELALRSNEEQMRLVLGAANDGIWELDGVTGEFSWSDRMYEMLELSPKEFHPNLEAVRRLIHPEDQDYFEEAVSEMQNDSDRFKKEVRIRRGDGTYRHFLGRGRQRLAAGSGALRVVGAMTDVTELLSAEERVREQAALIDQARDAILVRDLDDVIRFWNKGAERLYGWSPQEAIGRKVTELIYKDLTAFHEARRSLFERGSWMGELIQQSRDKRELIVECRWTLVPDGEEPKSILAINTDVTEKKSIESQFFRAQRMESIGTLASGIAHDLNNVLGPMLMAVDLLKLRMTDAQDLELLELMETSGLRGAEMVKQVLYFARGMEGLRTLVAPGQLVKELQQVVRDTFPKSITVESEVAADIWSATGDRTQFHQVLLNLCVNARDAMPRGGCLRISARNRRIDEQFAAMHPGARPGRYVLLEVFDTGEGMTEEVRARIFEPFFTAKEIGKGTGLGLSTTLAIVRSHGGFMNVESVPDQGTTFQVNLPAVDGDVPESPLSEQNSPRGNGEVILIIDDEASIRSITGQTLEAFGYRVATAGDGAEGVAIFAQRPGEFAAVLTDMMMPSMGGAVTISVLLRLDPQVKIIVASGSSRRSPEVLGLGDGVKAMISKPYTADTLLQTLHKVLHPDGVSPEA